MVCGVFGVGVMRNFVVLIGLGIFLVWWLTFRILLDFSVCVCFRLVGVGFAYFATLGLCFGMFLFLWVDGFGCCCIGGISYGFSDLGISWSRVLFRVFWVLVFWFAGFWWVMVCDLVLVFGVWWFVSVIVLLVLYCLTAVWFAGLWFWIFLFRMKFEFGQIGSCLTLRVLV